MSDQFTVEQLRELQALPFPRCHDVTKGKIAGDYFAQFLPVHPRFACIGCEMSLTGIFGTFTWGVVNGEGFCSNCHYPARAVHRLMVDGREECAEIILQYHPDELRERSAA